MLNIYKLSNISSDELIAQILCFQKTCMSGGEFPEKALDFYELFYLVSVRTPQNSTEKNCFVFLMGYALHYEGEIMEEIMEAGGMYDDSLENDAVAYELFQLSDYFIKADSGDKEHWEVIKEDMREVIASRVS